MFQEPHLQHIVVTDGADKPAYQVNLASKAAARSVSLMSANSPP
jgi:hypothetical protein